MKAWLRQRKQAKSGAGETGKTKKSHRLFVLSDQRGAAIVTVLVAMSLLVILASLILYTTLANYLIKTTQTRANNNFYSAETAMEEIRTGLSQEASNAATAAWFTVMQNYGSYDEETRMPLFRQNYFAYLAKVFAGNGFSGSLTDAAWNVSDEDLLDFLMGYLSVTDGVELAFEGEGVAIDATAEDSETSHIIAYTNGLAIEGLRLTYTDRQDYVSVITTDLVMQVPEMDFSSGNTMPGLLEYALVGDEGIVAGSESGVGGTIQIYGSVYGGAENGISVSNNTTVSFETNSGTDMVVTAGDLQVTGSNSQVSLASVSLYAQGIDVDSATFSGTNSNYYVADDMTITGRNSSVVLSGSYYGYGDYSTGTADYGPSSAAIDGNTLRASGSSSILVNGAGTTLNLGNLSTLELAGQAYIGTRSTNAVNDGILESGTVVTDDNSVSSTVGSSADASTGSDIRMGQSIAVKSDQMAYLVPKECLGLVDGTSTFSNPVNIGDYNTFMNNQAAGGGSVYDEVDLTQYSVGGKTLADYGAKAEKVFYQAQGASSTWIYYYLLFDTPEQAVTFFNALFTEDPETITGYLENYLTDFSMPSGNSLTLAGSVVSRSTDSSGDPVYALINQTLLSGDQTEWDKLGNYTDYTNTYHALTTVLSSDYSTYLAAVATGDVSETSVFENTIDEDTLMTLFSGDSSATHFNNNRVVGYGGESVNDAEILLINEDSYTLPSGASAKLVISTGDVVVSSNFNGLILAKGTITVQNGAVINADSSGVSIVLSQYQDVLACFKDSDVLLGDDDDTEDTEETDEEEEDNDLIDAGTLVIYRNWSKQ